MNIERIQHEALATLKSFNAAVTTSRLYPAASPQVANAVEKAYQAIKTFSRTAGQFSYGKSPDVPLVCGFQVAEQVAEELKNMVVYRHLALLNLEHVVLRPTFDRRVFSAILTVFTARKEKIAREGGGRSFVNELGLAHYFPEEAPELEYDPAQTEADEEVSFETAAVPQDLLNDLFSRRDPSTRLAGLSSYLQDTSRAIDLVVAGVAQALQELSAVEAAPLPTRSAAFSRFVRRVGGHLSPQQHQQVAAGAAAIVVRAGSALFLTRLYCQDYPDDFGRYLLNALVELVPNELFDTAMTRLRELSERTGGRRGEISVDDAIVAATVELLAGTPKGKLYLGKEKARSLLESSEQERRDKRIETGIGALLSGNLAGLRSEELLLNLPEEIEQYYRRGDGATADRLVEIMAAEMLGGDDHLRRRLIRSLVMVGSVLFAQKRWTSLEKMSGALISWIRESEEGDSAYEKAAFLLQVIVGASCQRGHFDRADQVLALFHKIRTGQLAKPPPIPALIGRIQDRSFNRPLFRELLQQSLESGAKSKAGERLTMMGRPAGVFLVDQLLQEEEPQDRLRIIDLLTAMGSVVLSVILEKLPEPMPWYGKRNLIKLTAELAGPKQVADIMPFLRHEDLRVQREAFACIYTISGERRKQALLDCFSGASEAMLLQIVKALHRFTDEETSGPLMVILADQEHYSEAVREPLLHEIIKALSRIPTATVHTALREFLDNRGKKVNRKLGNQVWVDAENALKAVSAEMKRASQPTPIEPPSPSPAAGAGPGEAGEGKGDTELARTLAQVPGVSQVKELVGQGKKELAREVLLEFIAKAVAKHRFAEAEALREWLIEIDPMALSEIIRAAELIEEEKISAIDRDQVEAWSDLYDVLTTEEFANFYHALKRVTYENEQFIVRQGDMQSGLYLINSGKVRISYRDASGDVLVKNATRGEILGADTVFEASVWTVSVSCLVRTEVLYLGIDTIYKWREESPALESKLHDFCLKSASLQAYFSRSGKDRRATRRHKLSGRVTSLLLDSRGRDTGIASKGELSDISTGGVSFFLRISQKKNARLLLGRSTRVLLPMEGAVERQVAVLGTIIAVRGHQAMENEYSVHVKFVDDISGSDLQTIVKTGKDTTLP
ncbi:cyclic nucleotide-binding domain-containing protein [Desulfofustis glycolicus]|uniref:cAMP-binding domain of CRP or a regulatory subunit of cAMP-dependent protein kinases n=1 Tax=Desulfofustis glycolicus DSM 9705 TaxID=1121409 RepID=A0A1M5T2U5_9BACT|nr:cyclic nucleotide-binding domain-containing protein [Desulfofustis glycolicus]MCB2215333.1 cyclic nucleotide-binding domain-containing protein [Desulfobulbaceae bacterium]SHH45089.1 cAMP-binding domain of CRP or a regulatory subunit of cAMP-dependent protein kinases [Desulfofustis glycolicus DSM 9705]